MRFAFPFVILASDGHVMRSLHPPALGRHRAAIEAALQDLLLDRGAAPPTATRAAPPVSVETTLTQREIAMRKGFTGDACTTCGQFAMRRSGTCATCDSCGSTSGCG